MKADEGLMKLIDSEDIPDPDTQATGYGGWGDIGTGQKGLKGLDEVRVALNRRIMKKDSREEYTLDADAMEIIAEKTDASFAYKGNKGYMPMAGFLFELWVCAYTMNSGKAIQRLHTGRGGFTKNARGGCPKARG